MPRKAIPVSGEPVLDFMGRPVRVPERDDNGDVLWPEELPEAERKEELVPLVPATLPMLLREVLLNLSNNRGLHVLQKPNDGSFAGELWAAVRGLEDRMEAGRNGHEGPPPEWSLRLSPKLYDWLHGLLQRPFPLTKEAQAENKTARDEGKPDPYPLRTLARGLWSISDDAVTQQLKALEDRRKPEEEEDDA